MKFRTLDDVQTFLNQKFGDQINHGTFRFSGNDRCVILTYEGQGWNHSQAIQKMKWLQKSIPEGLGIYERNKRFYFAPIGTAQQKVDFAEVEAWVIGTELLELSKQKIPLLEEYGAKLKAMVKLKREMEAA